MFEALLIKPEFSCCLKLKLSTTLLPHTNPQPHVSWKHRAPHPAVPRLWSCYWLISVMSAPGSRKEEVTSNLPLCSPLAPNSLTRVSAKTIRAAPTPHGRGQARARKHGLPLWGCSLTALFIFNCQKSPLILSSPLCVIRSVVVVLQPRPSLCTLTIS